MALAGELANTLVTRNSRATGTSQYLALQLRVNRKSARSRVQTPEYKFIVTREFKLPSTNLLRGLDLLVCYTLNCRLRVIES